MEHSLDALLTEIGTRYIDFFVVQGVEDTAFLTREVRSWVEESQRRGRLRYFGFATHRNMERCLTAAAPLGWIDGIVTAYNYRLMQQPALQDAIAACGERGIALTAIKSQGLESNPDAVIGDDSAAARQLLARLSALGVTEYQAKLMAVWSNPHVCSICSLMTDESMLQSNAFAAAHWQRFGAGELQALADAANATAHAYCAGCATICESSLEPVLPVADVMRFAMYGRGYGDRGRARSAFARLSPAVRAALAQQDFASAERRCPQGMPIGAVVRGALDEFAG